MLDHTIEMGEKNERYWFTGTKRDGLKGLSSVSSFLDSSFLTPESAQQPKPSVVDGGLTSSVETLPKAPTSAVFDLVP